MKNKHTHTKSDSNGLKFSLATRSWGWSDYHTDRGRALGTGSGPHRSLCHFIHLVSLPSCLAPKALNLQSALYFCAQGARSDFEESEFHICYYLCDVSETLCLSGHGVSSVSIFIEYPIKWSYNKGTYFIGCSQKLNATTYAMGLVQGLAQNNSSLNTCLFYCFYGFVLLASSSPRKTIKTCWEFQDPSSWERLASCTTLTPNNLSFLSFFFLKKKKG